MRELKKYTLSFIASVETSFINSCNKVAVDAYQAFMVKTF